MERAILKTLIYADIFNYPLTIREIHRWLIKEKTNLRKIESAVNRLVKKGKVGKKGELVFLIGRKALVSQRYRKTKHSYIYIRKVKIVSNILKIIPWIKLIGISGGLAMESAGKTDDIDLFIITSRNRLWLSRLLILGSLTLLGQRRKRGDTKKQSAGKICCNIILEEDKLEQENKDLYTAHEVLQMKVLWQRNGVYQKFLEENSWVFKFLPNWISTVRGPASSVSRRTSSVVSLPAVMRRDPSSLSPLTDLVENLARKFQLRLMKEPQGLERIQEGAVYFHPEDYRQKVLKEFKQRLATLDKKR